VNWQNRRGVDFIRGKCSRRLTSRGKKWNCQSPRLQKEGGSGRRARKKIERRTPKAEEKKYPPSFCASKRKRRHVPSTRRRKKNAPGRPRTDRSCAATGGRPGPQSVLKEKNLYFEEKRKQRRDEAPLVHKKRLVRSSCVSKKTRQLCP